MKIVLVGPVYPFRGGIAHYTTMLAQGLGAEHDVTVISFSRQYPAWLYPGPSDRDPSQQPLAISARYLIDSLAPWTWLQAANEIAWLRPDAVLLQWWSTFWAPAFWTMAARLRHRGLAPLFLAHNVLPHNARAWDAWLTRRVLRQGRGCVVQSQREKERLLALLPGAAVEVFPHPVYSMFNQQPQPPAEARRQLGLPADCQLLLFFGIVRPYKGLRYLLEALRLLHDAGRPWRLLVAGEFWEDPRAYEAEIARLGLRAHVRLVNRYIPNEEVGLYFAAADIFVAPHAEASASGAVRLALGFGVPVVATRPDDSLEAFGPRVKIAPPKDPAALAEAIEALASAGLGQAHAAPAEGAGWAGMAQVLQRLLEAGRG